MEKDRHSIECLSFFMKIVLMSSFCTNRRIAKSSFTLSKLRFRYLALHKNNLIISDFEVGEREFSEFRDFREELLKLLKLSNFPNTPIAPISLLSLKS